MTHLTLGVLGAMQATLADGQTAKFRSDQTRALLAFLAVEADRPHRRDALVGLLWPDEPEAVARHNLRQALVNLRRTIGDHAAQPPFLLITHHEIQFNRASDFALDATQFDAHLAACAAHTHARLDDCAVCAPRLQQAADLYRGQFLQEFFLKNSAAFEEWALARREAFHQRVLDALAALGTYYERHGDTAAARRAAARALELDPWREEAHRQLMRAFALEGQHAAALAQYETCRRLLAEEMDVEPSSETRELFEKIKRGDWTSPGGERAAALATGLRPPDTNLPAPLTPFIGRERELQDLGRLIADPACRWITLVGPGGMGKTRLAVQAAAGFRSVFALGAAFVPLVAVESADAIVPAIADALGFSFYGAASPRSQLFGYLRDKPVLLVLDNVEQLSSAADVFVELLQHTTELKVLMTSREPLNAQGEWVFPVEGLQMPDDDGIRAMEASAAVALFVQRAQRTRIGYALSPADHPAVARLCRLVDGTPLALELAATWVRTLPVQEIAAEIERSLDFLSAPVRDLPARHRSVRVVFDRSWELLAKDEQAVLRRLSVFRGGFRRDAAEHVAGASLSTLSALVAKSLVRRSGEHRYDLHDLVRQFAAERLAENDGEPGATQARHAEYYLAYFARMDGRLRGSGQREALAELTAEMDNFRFAWDWAVAHGEFALIEQAMRLFPMLYDTRGWLQEGLDALGRAAAALESVHGAKPAERSDQIALAHILTARAVLATRLGRQEQAQAMLERSTELLRPLHEPRVLVETLAFLGNVLEFSGNYARAAELYAQGLQVAADVGDRWFAALCRLMLAGEGSLRLPDGHPEASHRKLRAVVDEWRGIGDPRLTAIALNNLSWVAARLGKFAEARDALQESMALSASSGDRFGLGFAYRGLGLIAQAQGEHRQALDMFRKSLDTLAELGARQDVARVLVEMGRSYLALGDDAAAGRAWREALRITLETQSTFVALDALAGMAALHAKQGDLEQALELLSLVLNHPASIQETRDRAETLHAELAGRANPEQLELARARTFDEAVARALA